MKPNKRGPNKNTPKKPVRLPRFQQNLPKYLSPKYMLFVSGMAIFLIFAMWKITDRFWFEKELSRALPKLDPTISETDVNEICYTILCRHLACDYYDESVEVTSDKTIYYIKILGDNPPPELFERVKARAPNIDLGSNFEEGKGLIFGLDKFQRIDKDTIEVHGYEFASGLAAHGFIIILRKHDTKWEIVKRKTTWIA